MAESYTPITAPDTAPDALLQALPLKTKKTFSTDDFFDSQKRKEQAEKSVREMKHFSALAKSNTAMAQGLQLAETSKLTKQKINSEQNHQYTTRETKYDQHNKQQRAEAYDVSLRRFNAVAAEHGAKKDLAKESWDAQAILQRDLAIEAKQARPSLEAAANGPASAPTNGLGVNSPLQSIGYGNPDRLLKAPDEESLAIQAEQMIEKLNTGHPASGGFDNELRLPSRPNNISSWPPRPHNVLNRSIVGNSSSTLAEISSSSTAQTSIAPSASSYPFPPHPPAHPMSPEGRRRPTQNHESDEDSTSLHSTRSGHSDNSAYSEHFDNFRSASPIASAQQFTDPRHATMDRHDDIVSPLQARLNADASPELNGRRMSNASNITRSSIDSDTRSLQFGMSPFHRSEASDLGASITSSVASSTISLAPSDYSSSPSASKNSPSTFDDTAQPGPSRQYVPTSSTSLRKTSSFSGTRQSAPRSFNELVARDASRFNEGHFSIPLSVRVEGAPAPVQGTLTGELRSSSSLGIATPAIENQVRSLTEHVDNFSRSDNHLAGLYASQQSSLHPAVLDGLTVKDGDMEMTVSKNGHRTTFTANALDFKNGVTFTTLEGKETSIKFPTNVAGAASFNTARASTSSAGTFINRSSSSASMQTGMHPDRMPASRTADVLPEQTSPGRARRLSNESTKRSAGM